MLDTRPPLSRSSSMAMAIPSDWEMISSCMNVNIGDGMSEIDRSCVRFG